MALKAALPITSKWDVQWCEGDANGKPRRDLVALTDGYTTMDSIPDILSVKTGIDPAKVYITRMDRIKIQ